MLGSMRITIPVTLLVSLGEIADAQWFAKDTLPQTPPKTAISGWPVCEFISQIE